MNTVHGKTTSTTSSTNTGHVGRMKPTQIACAECKRTNDCDCLSQLRLLDLMAPLVRQVVEHLPTGPALIDGQVIEHLAMLIDRNDQRERELAALDRHDRSARDLIADVLGSWGYEPSFRRDPVGIATKRKVPVDRVRALVDGFLRDAAVERRAA